VKVEAKQAKTIDDMFNQAVNISATLKF